MNPLPPLPLVDGHFLIDNSTIELLRCPRLLELQWLRKRVLSASKAGRNFGSTLHAGWATRYRQCGVNRVTPDATILIHESMRQYLDASPQPLEDFRTFDHACRVMDCYNAHYEVEEFKLLSTKDNKPYIEFSFMHPFDVIQGIPVWYTGKLDLGIQDSSGIWVMDHKSAFMFGKGWETEMTVNNGQRGYVWELKNTLAPDLLPLVKGYIIDGVRIRRPKKEAEYTNEAPVDSSDLLRFPVYITDDDIEEWRDNTTKLIGNIFDYHRSGYFPRHNWHCSMKYGLCDMYDVCSIPRERRQGALDSQMYEDNLWSPLNKPQ